MNACVQINLQEKIMLEVTRELIAHNPENGAEFYLREYNNRWLIEFKRNGQWVVQGEPHGYPSQVEAKNAASSYAAY